MNCDSLDVDELVGGHSSTGGKRQQMGSGQWPVVSGQSALKLQ